MNSENKFYQDKEEPTINTDVFPDFKMIEKMSREEIRKHSTMAFSNWIDFLNELYGEQKIDGDVFLQLMNKSKKMAEAKFDCGLELGSRL